MDDTKPHEHRVTGELAEESSTSAIEQKDGGSKERYECASEYEGRLSRERGRVLQPYRFRRYRSDSGRYFDACLRDKVKLQRAHGGCLGDERR